MKAKIILAAVALAAIVSSCADNNKTSLFNGKDLNGWVCVVDSESTTPASEVFGVADGCIRIAGKPFVQIDVEGLEQLAVKLRTIKRKGGLKLNEQNVKPAQLAYVVIDPNAPKN